MENYTKFKLAEENLNIDLYIMGMVDNDLLIKNHDRYPDQKRKHSYTHGSQQRFHGNHSNFPTQRESNINKRHTYSSSRRLCQSQSNRPRMDKNARSTGLKFGLAKAKKVEEKETNRTKQDQNRDGGIGLTINSPRVQTCRHCLPPSL